MTVESTETLRENVWSQLEAQAKTLSWLAEDAEISRSMLSVFLHGQGGITLDRAEKIATSLGLTLVELLTPERKAKRRRRMAVAG